MKKLGITILLTVSFLGMACSVSAAGDLLITTVQLDDTGRVTVTTVTQGPASDQGRPQYANPEYRIEIQRDGKKIAEQSFPLQLGEMLVHPVEHDKPSTVVKQKNAVQNLVISLSTAGGTTDQYTVKVFKGTSEVFSSTLDKLPFTREAGVTDPIRSKEENELLEKAKQPAQVPGAANGGFPWAFVFYGIIGLIVIAGIIVLIRYFYWRRQLRGD